MKYIAVLAVLASAVMAAPVSSRAAASATATIRKMDALDETGFQVARMTLAEAGQLDTLAVVLKYASDEARRSWLSRLPEATAQRWEQRIASLGDSAPFRLAAATKTVNVLLAGPRLMLARASALYEQGSYRDAALECEKAFRAGAGGRFDFLYASYAWARAGDADAAFRSFDRAIASGWTDADMVAKDTDLVSLRSDKRWDPMLGRMRAAHDLLLSTLPDSHVAGAVVKLPEPVLDGSVSVEKCLYERRSVRQFSSQPLTLAEVSQLLWAAYGVTQPVPNAPAQLRGGLKTAPSAGGLYPLELYLVAGNVTGLATGVYSYRPENHELWQVAEGDRRQALYDASAEQSWVRSAPASIVYSAVFERTTGKYGERGRERYVCMDLGHSAENVCLEAVALGLGTCPIGAFVDLDVKVTVGMTKAEEPLYIMPVGHPTGSK